MFKKYTLGLLFCLLSASIVQGQSCLCDPKDDDRNHLWYTVSAPSGLSLRKGPNSQTAKLDAIPFGEEVLACGITNFTETIEGKSGNWLKVTWADKMGYLFSGFLQEIQERKVRFVIPNAGVDSNWDCLEFAPEIKWQGLVDLQNPNNSNSSSYQSYLSAKGLEIGKKKVGTDCSASGFLNHAVLNLSIAPYAVFSGFNLKNGVENQVLTPIKLMPGEVATFNIFDPKTQVTRSYLIAAEGKVFPNSDMISGDSYGPIGRIEQYKINLYQKTLLASNSDVRSSWSIQKLADETLNRPADTDTYDMDVLYIYFAGDLDGDHKLDLILARLNGAMHSFQLYLSSKSLPGFLVRYVARRTDSGC